MAKILKAIELESLDDVVMACIKGISNEENLHSDPSIREYFIEFLLECFFWTDRYTRLEPLRNLIDEDTYGIFYTVNEEHIFKVLEYNVEWFSNQLIRIMTTGVNYSPDYALIVRKHDRILLVSW